MLEDEDLSAPAFAEIEAGASGASRLGARARRADRRLFGRRKTNTFARARPTSSICATVSLRAHRRKRPSALGAAGRGHPGRRRSRRRRASSRSTGRARPASRSRPAAPRAMSRCWRAPAACRWSSVSGTFPRSDGALILLDGEQGEIEIAPSAARLADWRRDVAALAERRAEEARRAEAPAVTRSGQRIRALVNIQGSATSTPRCGACGRRRPCAHRVPVRAGPRPAGRGASTGRLSPDSGMGGRTAGGDPHARRGRRQADPRRDFRRRSESISRRARLAPVAAPAGPFQDSIARAGARGGERRQSQGDAADGHDARRARRGAQRISTPRSPSLPPKGLQRAGPRSASWSRFPRRRWRSSASTPISTRSAATTSCNT